MFIRRSVFAKIHRHASTVRRNVPVCFSSAAAQWSDDEERPWSEDEEHQQPEEHLACNERYEGIVKITETPCKKGLGIYASKDFAKGELVVSSNPIKTTSTRCSHSVQIDWNDRHILMDIPAVLINHSCEANVGIRSNSNKVRDDDGDEGAYDFLAINPIKKGDELTWDYEATEWEISTPFRCTCGSAKCRGMLRGFKDSGEIIRKQYGEHYADYLKETTKNHI